VLKRLFVTRVFVLLGLLAALGQPALDASAGRAGPAAGVTAPSSPRLRPLRDELPHRLDRLQVDPILDWNTFLGAAGQDEGFAVTLDSGGQVYVAGRSNATWGSPVRAYSAGLDGFVAKLDGGGNLLWLTFLGGSGFDQVTGLALDGSGGLVVAGTSDATWGSPVRAFSSGFDAFVARLDGAGNLVWNTFLGTSGPDFGGKVAADAGGNAYTVGTSAATWGSPVRAYTASDDAFVARLDGAGNLVWNTFLGGSASDQGFGVSLAGGGDLIMAGQGDASWGSPVRAYTAGQDAFAARLDGAGTLIWHSFLGGSGTDFGADVAPDGVGGAVLTGSSEATWGSPVRAFTVSGLNRDAFAARLDGGGGLTWNTFLGGAGDDTGFAVAVDGAANAYLAGDSTASWASPWRVFTAGSDAFVVKLDSAGTLVWNAFLGGAAMDLARAIAVTALGEATVVGVSGATWGNPVRPYTAGIDVSVARIAAAPPTAVQVLGFEARPDAGGRVGLTWATASEAGLVGFKLARAASADGPFTDVTPWLPGQGTAASGWRYSWLDAPGLGTHYYQLLVAAADAPLTVFGPRAARVSYLRLYLPQAMQRLRAK
jgi:hypothetical protein